MMTKVAVMKHVQVGTINIYDDVTDTDVDWRQQALVSVEADIERGPAYADDAFCYKIEYSGNCLSVTYTPEKDRKTT